MIGVLLINLGTPDEPTPKAVRRYLKQFLSDPLVIDIPRFWRWLLLNFIILPFRSKKSAALYQKIWTPEGSPLLINTHKLASKLSDKLGSDFVITYAMRYGNPSIETALNTLSQQKLEEIRVVPLYPQYASSSTESSLKELFRLVEKIRLLPPIEVVPPFYSKKGFVQSLASGAKSILESMKPDHVLFSFHGLPERQIKRLDKTQQHCFIKSDCCSEMVEANQACYRAHCFSTSRLLAHELKLKPEDYTVCFQSRLGRTPWIKPYTDEVIVELAKNGVKKLAVTSPSFVADCLETLEEIAMRSNELFREHGGEELKLIPCLNDSDDWVEALEEMIRENKAEPCNC